MNCDTDCVIVFYYTEICSNYTVRVIDSSTVLRWVRAIVPHSHQALYVGQRLLLHEHEVIKKCFLLGEFSFVRKNFCFFTKSTCK